MQARILSSFLGLVMSLAPALAETRDRPRPEGVSGNRAARMEKRLEKRERRQEKKEQRAAPPETEWIRGWGGPKHVLIDLSDQTLSAFEGGRTVMRSRISSGRGGATPTGHFAAGWKDADHYSSLYHNAPMPWSVQVRGDIFIHGYHEVPASHGCIRLPLTGHNPARRFFEWVDPGVPIRIVR